MSWQRLNDQLREYFTFTRKERNGITVLLCLLLLMQGAIIYTHYYQPEEDKTDIAAFQKEVLAFQASMVKEENDHDYSATSNTEIKSTVSLFSFNPNTINENDWKQLGVNEKVIHSIKNYLSKGGHFYKKEDLKKIYNLKKEEYFRLEPYILIPDKNDVKFAEKKSVFPEKKLVSVEVNAASKEELMTLPNIGEKRAEQIIKYRNRLGGFVNREQLKEVYSIPDSIYQMILPQITINTTLVKTIPLNSFSSDTIYHPYIKKNLLKLILNYRAQHGSYTDKSVLKKLPLMTDSVYRKVEAYMSLD